MGSEGMVIVKCQPEGESANQFTDPIEFTKPMVGWQAAGRNSRRSSPFLSAEPNYSAVLVACRTSCGVRPAAPAPSFFSPFCCGPRWVSPLQARPPAFLCPVPARP